MNNEFAFQSALELSRAVASRQVSPVELIQATLARVELLNPGLNCFAAYAPEQALEAARKAEHALMAGQPVGRLHGLPNSIKDLIAVKDLKCSFGSRVMADNVVTVDAPSVERIRSTGACIIGRTRTSEFGCKAVGDSPLAGITRKTPGGSSAGAAASVAAGTDRGVRSCNNTYVKPQVHSLMRAKLSANQAKSVRTILPFIRTILRPPASRSGDAKLALEDAGEIREIVDADCISDGLEQCSGLCTVKHSSARAYAPADDRGLLARQ